MSESAEALNRITSAIISGAITIHRKYGPGLLETAYLACLCRELAKAGLRFETQKAIPLIYEGVRLDCAYRADLIVEGAVLVEIKAVEAIARVVHLRQIRTYLQLADCRVGLLLNFGALMMKDGIERVVNRLRSSAHLCVNNVSAVSASSCLQIPASSHPPVESTS